MVAAAEQQARVKKPKFSDFNPVHLAEVAPESGIFTVELMPKCFPWRIEDNGDIRCFLIG